MTSNTLPTPPRRESVLRPGLFSIAAAADARRGEFDLSNESLMLAGIRPDLLLIGASLMQYWELQAYFGGTGAVLINRGIGGDASEYLRRRFAADALQLQPKLIALQCGSNDFGWDLATLSDAPIEPLCANLGAMAAAARDAGIPFALLSLLPFFGPAWFPAPELAPRKNALIAEVNRRLPAVAAANGAVFVDIATPLATAAGEMRPELTDDGVHPHHAGYLLMAEALRKALAAHGITPDWARSPGSGRGSCAAPA